MSIALMAALLIRLRFFLILLLGRAGSLGFAEGGRGRVVVVDVAVTKGHYKWSLKITTLPERQGQWLVPLTWRLRCMQMTL